MRERETKRTYWWHSNSKSGVRERGVWDGGILGKKGTKVVAYESRDHGSMNQNGLE